MKTFIWIFTLLTSVTATGQTDAIDRRALALAAQSLFPPVLSSVQLSRGFNELSSREKEILVQVQNLVMTTESHLHFDDNPESFRLKDDETVRFMKTPLSESGEIDVNLHKLNDAKRDIRLPFLFKTLFHEWAHKIGEPNWGIRDHVAQFIENETEGLTSQYAAQNGKITLFSIPRKNLPPPKIRSSLNRPQPTNAVLIERNGAIYDQTEELLQSLEEVSPVMRNLLSDANHVIRMAILGLISQSAKQMQDGLNAQLRAQWRESTPPPELRIEDFFKKFLSVGEDYRLLELQDLDISGPWVRIKAVWENRIDESGPDLPFKIDMNFEGMDLITQLPIPLSIAFRLPQDRALTPEDIIVAVRPNVDWRSSAQVRSVIRGGFGEISRLKISFASASQPEDAQLTVFDGQSQHWIKASAIEREKNGGYSATFEIPWSRLPTGRALVADSVVLDQALSIFLDRLVELNDDVASAQEEAAPNSLMPDKTGLWSLKSNQPHFLQRTSTHEPIALFVNNMIDEHHVNANGFDVEFELEHPDDVSEVRLHFSRSAFVVSTQLPPEKVARGETPGHFFNVDWNGKNVRVLSSGEGTAQANSFEILSAQGPAIQTREEDRKNFRAHFKIPFKPARDSLAEHEGHTPSIFSPILLEIVTRSGQTLQHRFSKASSEECEMNLTDSWGKGHINIYHH